jgi:hypothetical protein
VALGATLAVFPARANAAESPPLQERHGEATVDWSTGTLTAQGGAAADLRMPSADFARPGAERRARAAALARLKTALTSLPLGSDRTLPSDAVTRALERARVASVDYQSNGGVLLRLEVKFTDWIVPSPATADQAREPGPVLTVPTARLAAAPLLKIDRRELALGAATYRTGSPPAGMATIAARADRTGRLVVSGDPANSQKLAGAAVVIYVEKVTR